MRSAIFWDVRSVEWQFVTDVSGQHNHFNFNAWTFKDENNRSSRNAGKKLRYTVRIIQKIAVLEGH
jgi:hypothetical protein